MTPPSCTCCGKPRRKRRRGGWIGAHNWCGTCTNLWYTQGKPDGGPVRVGEEERARRISAGMLRWHAAHQQSPAALAALAAGNLAGREAGSAAAAERKADTFQDYTWLRSFGETQEQAAARVSVSRATSYRYERQRAAQDAAAGERAA